MTAPLGDYFGRKKTASALYFCQVITLALTCFTPNIQIYICLRFCSGFFALANLKTFVLVAETVTNERRAAFGVFSRSFCNLGDILCALAAYFLINSWRLQSLVLCFFLAIFLPFYLLLVPESPRWLLSQNRSEEATRSLQWIAKLNGNDPSLVNFGTIVLSTNDSTSETDDAVATAGEKNEEHLTETSEPPTELSKLITENKKLEKSSQPKSLLSLFSTCHGALVTFTIIFIWSSANFIFSGTRFGVMDIQGNLVRNTILQALTAFPGIFFMFVVNIYGRKTTLTIGFIICSLASAIVPFLQSTAGGNLQIVFAMITRCASTAVLSVVRVFASELFPTELRSTGHSFCVGCSRLAPMVVPFVVGIQVFGYEV